VVRVSIAHHIARDRRKNPGLILGFDHIHQRSRDRHRQQQDEQQSVIDCPSSRSTANSNPNVVLEHSQKANQALDAQVSGVEKAEHSGDYGN
jgi:hypothetical protein